MDEKLLEIKIMGLSGLSIDIENFCRIHRAQGSDGINEMMLVLHKEIDLIIKPLIQKIIREK